MGMGSVVIKDVPPFSVVIGNPAHFKKFNSQSLELFGIHLQDLSIEDGHLKSEQSYITECINSFHSHTRRKAVLIEDESLDAAAKRYILYLSKIGDLNTDCRSAEIIP